MRIQSFFSSLVHIPVQPNYNYKNFSKYMQKLLCEFLGRPVPIIHEFLKILE